MSDYAHLFSKIKNGEALTATESAASLEAMLRGDWTLPELVHFLEALRDKGEAVSEIVGFAQTLRQHMVPVPGILSAIDLCGTGGGPANRYNVSTATAFVLATAGVGVAKHGNRGSRSPHGSFDFIEALEIPILTDPRDLHRLFGETKLCFLYARAHHPAVARVSEARKIVGGRTVFNLIGPLCNPAGATKQVIGVSERVLGLKIATAAKHLGQSHVLVVAGDQGYDEITPFGQTPIWEMTAISEAISETLFRPSPQTHCVPDALFIADLSHSVCETYLAFEGKDTPIARYIALNAGAGLYCAGHVTSIAAGIQMAEGLLRSGDVFLFLKRYIAMARALA
jgi:anthranilate phosphoribosyltransferase